MNLEFAPAKAARLRTLQEQATDVISDPERYPGAEREPDRSRLAGWWYSWCDHNRCWILDPMPQQELTGPRGAQSVFLSDSDMKKAQALEAERKAKPDGMTDLLADTIADMESNGGWGRGAEFEHREAIGSAYDQEGPADDALIDAADKLHVGAIVMLSSGGPLMTVKETWRAYTEDQERRAQAINFRRHTEKFAEEPAGKLWVRTIWFDDVGHLHQFEFQDSSVLRKVRG